MRRVYAHLGEVRPRSEVVEYRVAQHLKAGRGAAQEAGDCYWQRYWCFDGRRNGSAPRQRNCQRGGSFGRMGLGRVELPTSRLSGDLTCLPSPTFCRQP